MTVYEFGRELLRLKDLDPVYAVVRGAQLDSSALRRWLLSYWAFYHVGTASWAADRAVGYWERMKQAAGSAEYPRSAERRHYRGDNARTSVAYLENRGLSSLFADIENAGPTAVDVINVATQWRAFGPWIGFKVADMIDRVGLRPVTFDAATAMYEGSPQKAALLLYATERPDDPSPQGKAAVQAVSAWAAERVMAELAGELAPPDYTRPLGFAECETILCKFGSYLKGHYHLGEDVESVRKGLSWRPCGTSRKLYAAGTEAKLWS